MRIGTLCFNVGDLAGARKRLSGPRRSPQSWGASATRRGRSAFQPILYYHGQVDEAEQLALQALDE